MGNVIPPEFGVPLSADELSSSIPTSILYGVTPSDQFIPIKISADGTVATTATFSGTISIGTVTIEGEDPADHTDHPLAVVNFGPDGYALRTAIFDGGNLLTITPDGALQAQIGAKDFNDIYHGLSSIDISNGNWSLATSLIGTTGNILAINPDGSININTQLISTPVYEFDSVIIPFNAETDIITYTVPSNKTLIINSVTVWGNAWGEIFIKADGTQIGGGKIFVTERTKKLDSKMQATQNQIVTVSFIHDDLLTNGNIKFSANFYGSLI